MTSVKKKIALLTLRVDNNYGGNLQRFALATVLSRMGYEVIHLYFRSEWCGYSRRKRIKNALKNVIKKFVLLQNICIFPWKKETDEFLESRSHTEPFYNRYIKHSPMIYSRRKLESYVKTHRFGTFIVGSDQVWRKRYTQRWGVDLFFLSFVKRLNVRKVAYGVSFGLASSDYSDDDIKRLTYLYNQFDAVSVRELSGLDILQRNNWTSPVGTLVSDPTLLLDKSDYERVIEDGDTATPDGDMFCYLLDVDEQMKELVTELAEKRHLTPFWASITGENRISIEQWLRSFRDAKLVVTNSYHGVVFSLIFNKPFKLLLNEERGNARFYSLKETFELPEDCTDLDWSKINKIKEAFRKKSMRFLTDSLNSRFS